MAAYAYYELDNPLVPDYVYDEWCQRYGRVKYRVKHHHKELIKGVEKTGSVSPPEWPGRVIGAVEHYLKRYAY